MIVALTALRPNFSHSQRSRCSPKAAILLNVLRQQLLLAYFTCGKAGARERTSRTKSSRTVKIRLDLGWCPIEPRTWQPRDFRRS